MKKTIRPTEAAKLLGISPERVSQIAAERGIGTLRESGYRIFTSADLKKLRPKPPGRPKIKDPSPATLYRRERRARGLS
jgi:hypothetical protein